MPANRDRALDAAIALLGTRGLKGLTHRGVDAAAGLPQGSTSNHFRTRNALLAAVVARLVERDREDWASLGAARLPATLTDLADGLAGYVLLAVGRDRVRTTARFVLVAAAATDPTLAAPIGAGRAELVAWGSTMLAMLGAADPHRNAVLLTDYLDGVILHRLTPPPTPAEPAAAADQFDPRAGIVTVLGAVFGADAGRF
ncbi:TetR/AcrR family transcriptional regulator [Rhodococcus sp. NPDC058505]|uniref:TetR/AcrR family transcriptional regulator n=1 Tax=unclassified Rhodococcus (in: high G+C Gram-positive bacteria) TaxID=192944 RepID=UPI0036563D9A